MKTKRLTSSQDDLKTAAEFLRAGEVVGIPTETVYGLAANATDETAVRKVFAAKGRPADNPLIVHVSAADQVDAVATDIPQLARQLFARFSPGPLTIILPKRDLIPAVTSGGLDTIGVRIPSHPVTRALLEVAEIPLAAPSANRSGYPSPTTADHVLRDMEGKIAAVVDGGACQVGVESTVISIAGDVIHILRPGAVTAEMLSEEARVEIDPAVTHALTQNDAPCSPGMKYRHYAPRANVTLLRGTAYAISAYTAATASDPNTYVLFYQENEGATSASSYDASTLFARLRAFDEAGAKQIYVQAPDPEGIGLAVYNRLIRAAGFEVIDVG